MVETSVARTRTRAHTRSREITERAPVVDPATYFPLRLRDPHTAVIFIPGVFLHARDASVERVAKPFADVFGVQTRALTVRLPEKNGDAVKKEAAAIKAHLENLARTTDLNRFVIVGMSNGGNAAISVAARNNEASAYQIDGLVLINPRGLDHQSSMHLKVGATRDAIATGASCLFDRERRKVINRYLGDSIRGALRERRFKQFSSTIGTCVSPNPDMTRVTAPVYIVTGGRDHVSHSSNIIPDRSYRKQPDRREFYVKRSLFPHAADVRMDVIDGGRHAYALFEPHKVAIMAREAMEQMGVIKQTARRHVAN